MSLNLVMKIHDHSYHPSEGTGTSIISLLTRSKISKSLIGRKDSEITALLRSFRPG